MTDLPRTGRRRLLAMLTTLPVAMRAGPLCGRRRRPPVAAPFAESSQAAGRGPGGWRAQSLGRRAAAGARAIAAARYRRSGASRSAAPMVSPAPTSSRRAARRMGRPCCWCRARPRSPGWSGDPRAQFDVGHWVPVMAGASSGIVVGRPTVLAPNGRARVAAAGPGSLDLAALLGIHLLGARMEPVFGLAEPAAAQSAFAQGAVDAVLLRGHRRDRAVRGARRRRRAAAVRPGRASMPAARSCAIRPFPTCRISPNCSRRAPATRRAARCTMHGVPPRRPCSWSSAWCCRSSRRPRWWRCGGAPAPMRWPLPGVQATAATVNVRPLAGPTATASTAVIAVGAPALAELRRWLASRFNWRPA